jgi:predicted TIM-barrel fold metal-dependent hydrolase
MRINCHTHIFNLRSVFTAATQDTLVNRIVRENWPPYVVTAVSDVIHRVVTGENLDEKTLLSTFVSQISASADFKSAIDQLNGKIPPELQLVIQGNLDGLAVGALQNIVQRFGGKITSDDDAKNQTTSDLVAFLLTGIKSSIGEVADDLISLTPQDAVLVTLTLDITDDTADDRQWNQQVADTSDAALAYPGRILPFVAVNPARKNHFEIMDRALTQQGFVGVKLYPSLGYDVSLDNLGKVFAYCEDNDVPLLLHCNRGGFRRTADTVKYCDPDRWRPVLEKHPNLRVCFGHFGGDENFTQQDFVPGSWENATGFDPENWTLKILNLMTQYPGVYADISYHTDTMSGGEPEQHYFHNLVDVILKADIPRQRVLFGTDYFLVRQRVRDDNFWKYFEDKFSADDWEQITEINPRAFLGLPKDDGTAARPNIQRHVNWLIAHKNDVQCLPAAWALQAANVAAGAPVEFVATALGPKWSGTNPAHVAVWRYLGNYEFRPPEQALTFEDAGSVKLRQLKYWNVEHESPDISLNKRRLVADGLHRALLASGVQIEPAFTAVSAEEALIEKLADGDAAVYEFAATVDAAYRFPNEKSLA